MFFLVWTPERPKCAWKSTSDFLPQNPRKIFCFRNPSKIFYNIKDSNQVGSQQSVGLGTLASHQVLGLGTLTLASHQVLGLGMLAFQKLLGLGTLRSQQLEFGTLAFQQLLGLGTLRSQQLLGLGTLIPRTETWDAEIPTTVTVRTWDAEIPTTGTCAENPN